jgi:hypothetical protein
MGSRRWGGDLTLPLLGAAAAVSTFVAWKWGGIAWTQGNGGDYVFDAGPAIDQLAAGHWVQGLRERTPLMGPLSILLRVPLVAVTHWLSGGQVADYRVGSLACVLPAGVFAAALARVSPSTARVPLLGVLVVIAAVATPAAGEAVRLGHPEEILAAALAVAAVTAATRDRFWATTVLLGLAVATKQWAALAIPPAVLLFPGRRVKMVTVAAALGLALSLPQILVNPFGYWSMSRSGVNSLSKVDSVTWWYLLGDHMPRWFAALDHPAIALLPFLAAVVLRWRQSRDTDILGLLALILLLRCTLDTANISYYHAPFFLATLAWETVGRPRRFPYLTVASVACLMLTTSVLSGRVSDHTVGVFYFTWTAAVTGFLLWALYGPTHPVRSRAVNQGA